MSSTTVTWGFIGLGNIGYPMAVNLRKNMPNCHKLMILDVNTNTMERFVKEIKKEATGRGGASNSMIVETSNDPKEIAERATVIITCLPSPKIVKDTFGSILRDGPLPALTQERLFIDCSTVDLTASREVAHTVHQTNSGHFVDAPVSGGVVGAWAGTVSFMFGAPKSDTLVSRIRSVLLMMGKTCFHMGNQGAGVCSKLANNYILSISNIATAEAYNMAQKAGLDLKVLTELFRSSTGRCWPVECNNPVPGVDENAPSSNGYEPGGTINIIKKDLGLAMAAAEASGAVLALAGKAHEVYESVAKDDGGRDFSYVLYQWLQSESAIYVDCE